MMMSGSAPFSFAIASICWSSGLVVAIYLLNCSRSSLCGVACARILKLHLEPGTFDARQRHPMRPAPFLEQQVALVHPGKPSGKCRLAVDRLTRHHLRQPALKSPV